MVTTLQRQSFAETRLQQIARLAALQQERPQDINPLGITLIRGAIFAMVLDCREAGVPMRVIASATTGECPSWRSAALTKRKRVAPGPTPIRREAGG